MLSLKNDRERERGESGINIHEKRMGWGEEKAEKGGKREKESDRKALIKPISMSKKRQNTERISKMSIEEKMRNGN
jgi:hypothetical protein